ncbi:adenylosuccinate lyase [Colletotrichum costaricense]|uniref:Adenylosuccinate lyase n=2 Tax=Colletotrichum acutatum species complex TaxID=2707335 RepID=A0AAI9YFP7_9PEZI|nr:adenylosuccinate lyase [Colletotrichum costaricense]XP_060383607.1 adenylosuccinate lyase [Colletotrichum tamarilloi]KAK1501684.1 adenylosuccinate lyase [Colletotrichum tamarilloi]KAK1505981.1 adenylosuccinate lyase [Colletotrichum costaricense]
MSGLDTYKTPLDGRYASEEAKKLFSQRNRHSTWRQLWLWLAESEKELGIDGISEEALEQMRAHLTLTDEDFKVAAVEEKRRRHDVILTYSVADVHAFGQVAPAAAGIIHLGATSCFVTDNAELILMRNAMDLLLPKLAKVIHNLSQFALQHKELATLGFTHYQAAQLITVGRRAAQWIQDLCMDLKNIETARERLAFRGAMGTTGTQASFMEIFQGDGAKIDKLNDLLCEKAGFPKTYDISTQTYTRKTDLDVSNAICGLGATAMHITNDIRHLAHSKEMEEPFEKDQIGSSAIWHTSSHWMLAQAALTSDQDTFQRADTTTRNPMRSERICSLGRKLRSLPANFADTYADQWFERTLDDSAIRRIDIPEMFLLAEVVLTCLDAILLGLDNVTSGLVIYPEVIRAHVMEELPFMATENIIMKIVAKGGSRQEAHEEIRVLSHQAADVVKKQGGKNDLIERIKATEYFKPVWDSIDQLLDPNLFTGRSATMVQRYCGEGGPVQEQIKPYAEYIKNTGAAELNV